VPGERIHARRMHDGRVDITRRHTINFVGPPDGPLVMLAHGFGCDQHMWRHIVDDLAAEHRVLLFDHVGSGQSDPAAWDADRYATLDGYADDVLTIINELDLPPVTFVGHSVSSMIGVLAANRQPERFAALVLITPSPCYIDEAGYRGGFSRADVHELLESLDSNYLGWSATMAPVIVGNPDRPELGDELTASFCATDPAMAAVFARATFLSDNRADLGRTAVPTLILQCRDDVIAPPEVGEYVHQHIAGSRLVTLDATGHCPQLSAPEQTAAATLSFLATV
jgi:sigma-B regulation protein RsbQ